MLAQRTTMQAHLASQIDRDRNGRIIKYLDRIGSLFKGGIEEASVEFVYYRSERAKGEYFASLRGGRKKRTNI